MNKRAGCNLTVSASEHDPNWYVIRTNIRCEDKAARSLRAVGYRVFVPKMRKDVVHHRSKKWITKRLVLFNRYIFIRMTTARKQDFYTLRDCDGVESILGINGTPAIIPRETVAQFMLAQRRRQFDDIHVNLESGRARRNKASSRFRLGTLVRALDGPFTSFAGHVTNITGRGMIKVAIEIFGRLSPIEFEFDQIEAVDANVEAA